MLNIHILKANLMEVKKRKAQIILLPAIKEKHTNKNGVLQICYQ